MIYSIENYCKFFVHTYKEYSRTFTLTAIQMDLLKRKIVTVTYTSDPHIWSAGHRDKPRPYFYEFSFELDEKQRPIIKKNLDFVFKEEYQDLLKSVSGY